MNSDTKCFGITKRDLFNQINYAQKYMESSHIFKATVSGTQTLTLNSYWVLFF